MAVGRITQLTETHRPLGSVFVTDGAANRTALDGAVEIHRVVDAVNSLPPNSRAEMIGSLKHHAPHVRWITLHDGSLSVA